jgi:holo-[acyl-carrier protein] synthase
MVECNRFLDWSAFKKQRIFTKKELEHADNDNANSERHLANFWAAREAFLKALGTGFGESIAFSDVSVIHGETGRPELLVVGGAKAALKEIAGANARVHVSITDQDDYSAAVVIIESQ